MQTFSGTLYLNHFRACAMISLLSDIWESAFLIFLKPHVCVGNRNHQKFTNLISQLSASIKNPTKSQKLILLRILFQYSRAPMCLTKDRLLLKNWKFANTWYLILHTVWSDQTSKSHYVKYLELPLVKNCFHEYGKTISNCFLLKRGLVIYGWLRHQMLISLRQLTVVASFKRVQKVPLSPSMEMKVTIC